MPELNLVKAINQALHQEMARDPSVICLGEDVGLNGGVFRVTDGLQKKFGPDRCIDTPLSEAGIIGTSIGLAMAGMKPVAEIQFEGFLGPGYDQLCTQASRAATARAGRSPVQSPCAAPSAAESTRPNCTAILPKPSTLTRPA